MRNTFIKELIKYAEMDPRIVLITGDLGYSVLEPFQKKFPERFINAGIAEQNMTGLAAGLALSGKIPFTYSIANFATLRCLEQIRNDICYHNANAKIVSVGSGFAYGTQGYTHHGTEDISIMRCLPNMNVFSPADSVETQALVKAMVEINGPCYLRLAKADEPILHDTLDYYTYPKMIQLRSGLQGVILSTGVITGKIAEFLSSKNLNYAHYSVPSIKPLDVETLTALARSFHTILTVEEHQLNGGFGSAVLESLNNLQMQGEIVSMPKVYRYGVDDKILSDMTTPAFADFLTGQWAVSQEVLL